MCALGGAGLLARGLCSATYHTITLTERLSSPAPCLSMERQGAGKLHCPIIYYLNLSSCPRGAAGGLIPSRAGRVRVPGEIDGGSTAPARVSFYVSICSGVQTAGFDRVAERGGARFPTIRLSLHFTKGPGQTVPRCYYFDDAERVHAVLCRERGRAKAA
jgi:hypothetical protein